MVVIMVWEKSTIGWKIKYLRFPRPKTMWHAKHGGNTHLLVTWWHVTSGASSNIIGASNNYKSIDLSNKDNSAYPACCCVHIV